MIDSLQHAWQEDSIRNSVLYIGGSVVGIAVNWCVKWLRGTVNCVFDMLITRPKQTIASFMTQIITLSAFIATGQLDDVKAATAIALGVGAGASIDFWLNRAKGKTWSKKERDKGERAEISSIKLKLRKAIKK